LAGAGVGCLATASDLRVGGVCVWLVTVVGGRVAVGLGAGTSGLIGSAVVAGHVDVAGRLGLRDLFCRIAVVGSPLVALLNTVVRSSQPRV